MPFGKLTPVETQTFKFGPLAGASGEFPTPANYQATQLLLQESNEDRAVTVWVGVFGTVGGISSGSYFRIPPGTTPIPYAILAYDEARVGSILPTGPGGPGMGVGQVQIVVPDVPYYTIVPADRRLYCNVRGTAVALGGASSADSVLVSITSYPAEMAGDTGGFREIFREMLRNMRAAGVGEPPKAPVRKVK